MSASTSSEMTTEQGKQIKHLLIQATLHTVQNVFIQAALNKQSAQDIISHTDLLESTVEKALSLVLRYVASQYSTFSETTLLKPVACFSLKEKVVSEEMDLFYSGRQEGAYIGIEFSKKYKDHFFDKNIHINFQENRPYTAFFLKKTVSDEIILQTLAESTFSSLEDIMLLVKKQDKGQKGFLIADGGANIFYIQDVHNHKSVLSVHFNKMNMEWIINDWDMNENGDWGWGTQVIFPGCSVFPDP